jgi:pimeloyl-ACP methyl ester carboxylesterase
VKRTLGVAGGVACVFLLSAPASPAAVSRQDFSVQTTDGVSIHAVRKFRAEGQLKIPVLLVHGTFGNSAIWDAPGRSVMDYLAARGYDVYALDLRGMGQSDRPASYWTIGLLDRVQDVTAVAGHILTTTGRRSVVAGHSQGGLLAGLAAWSSPELFQGVGLFSISGNGFYLPPAFVALMQQVIESGVDRYHGDPGLFFALAFGLDPVTGRPTIGPEAFAEHYAASEADSVRVILEELSPAYYDAVIAPIWPGILMPALVVDGSLDLIVGDERATVLYDVLGSEDKELVLLPRNSHTWFAEDNFHATFRVFDGFLARISAEGE